MLLVEFIGIHLEILQSIRTLGLVLRNPPFPFWKPISGYAPAAIERKTRTVEIKKKGGSSWGGSINCDFLNLKTHYQRHINKGRRSTGGRRQLSLPWGEIIERNRHSAPSIVKFIALFPLPRNPLSWPKKKKKSN